MRGETAAHGETGKEGSQQTTGGHDEKRRRGFIIPGKLL